MKKKPKILKPRVFIPLIILLLFYIGCGIYILYAGRANTTTLSIGKPDYIAGSLSAESSDERVMRVHQASEHEDEYGIVLTVETERTGSGSATLYIKFDMVDNETAEGKDTIELEEEMQVLPFGILYNKYDEHFNGTQTILFAAIGTMLIVAATLVFSIIEKQRLGAFSYSLVSRCGLIIFCIINSVIIIREWIDLSDFDVLFSFRFIMEILFGSGQTFVELTVIPLGLLALALSVSNILLVRNEGFSPRNLLGFFLGIVMMGGVAVMHWLNHIIDYESLEGYYLSAFPAILFAFIYSYFECMLLATIACAVLCTRYKPPYNLDYLIILGCAIRADGTPTPLLRGRADRALTFEKEQFEKTGKHAKFVPSGGQGSDEIISEAESMKRYLMEQGVPEEQIIKEDKSVNTYQNMAFSKKVIEADAESLDDVNIGFSTTNYHVFRGYTLANIIKMKVRGLSAKTKLYFFPNAFIREFIGLVWEQKFRHFLFVVMLTFSLAGIYFLTVFE